MKATRTAWKQWIGIVGMAVLLAACSSTAEPGNDVSSGGAEQKETAPLLSTEPVTITFLSSLSDDVTEVIFLEPMQKKHPHVKLEIIKKGTGSQLTDLITAGRIPDLVLDDNTNLGLSKDLGVFMDHSELVKRHQIDLNRVEPVVIEAIMNATEDNKLYGLPYFINVNALYYNKNIFDRFGEPYPKNGMSWDETIELAQKMTRDDYKGLHYERMYRIAESISPDYVDRKTLKATVNTDDWRRIFALAQRILSIPNNQPPKIENGYRDDFFKVQNFAMMATINVLTAEPASLEGGFRLGVAQYPALPGRPNISGYVSTGIVYVTEQSKHKDQAMLVLKEMMSDETQISSSRRLARATMLKSNEVKDQLGKDVPYLKDLDLSAVYLSKPAPGPAFTAYSSRARNIVQAQYVQFVEGKHDLNTALRLAEEEINKMVEAEQKK